MVQNSEKRDTEIKELTFGPFNEFVREGKDE